MSKKIKLTGQEQSIIESGLPICSVRQRALHWWNQMNLEEQFYKTIKHNDLITRDCTRHPHTLTGREIEIIYKAHVA